MSESITDKVKIVLLVLYAVGIPTHMLVTNAAIALLALLWLVEGKWKQKWDALQLQSWVYLFLIYYLLHVLAHFTYTTNREASAFDLEVKFSIWLIPVLLTGSVSLFTRFRDTILLAFAYTTALWCAAMIGFGIWSALQDGNAEHLMYLGMVGPFGKHYHYLSMFGIVAILIFLHVRPMMVYEPYFRWSFSILILFLVFLSMARMQIVIGILTLPVTAYLLYKHHKPNLLQWFKFGGLTVILIASLLILAPMREATQIAYQSLKSTTIETGKAPEAGRMLEWEAAFQVFKEASLMGVGPGDVQTFLDGYYTANQFTEGYKKHLNAHNQYLQTLAGLGVVGFIVLTAMLLSCFVQFYRVSDRLGFLVLSVFALSMATESALCVNNGIAFFAFIIPLLLISLPNRGTGN
jgi:O-antigen ligase